MNKTSTSTRSSKDPASAKTSNCGRPAIKPFPEPIPHTLENVTLSLLNTPPKQDHAWEYLKKGE